MKRTLVLLTFLIALGLIAAPAFGQETVSIVCTGSTVCSAAAGAFATQSTGTNPLTFNVTNTGTTGCPMGDSCEAYLAILVPSTTLSSGFKVNGVGIESGEPGTFNSSSSSLWSALGESGGQDNTFSPWQTTAQAAGASITASGFFSVYDFLLKSFTGPGSVNVAVTLSGLPAGTGFAAFYEDAKCETAGTPCTEGPIVDNTALSKSLVDVPEPASMALLASALLGACGLLRRKLLS
jgi:hypothetical protein